MPQFLEMDKTAHQEIELDRIEIIPSRDPEDLDIVVRHLKWVEQPRGRERLFSSLRTAFSAIEGYVGDHFVQFQKEYEKWIIRAALVGEIAAVSYLAAQDSGIRQFILDYPNNSNQIATFIKGELPNYGLKVLKPTIPEAKAAARADAQPKELMVNKDQLNQILAAPSGSEERFTLEQRYVISAQSLGQVDTGLMTINDPELRKSLIRTRYELRKKGTSGLRPLSIKEQYWANKNKIHPEILGMATDQYFEAKKMLTDYMDRVGRDQFFEEFRPDLIEMLNQGVITQEDLNKITIDDLLVNPGGMVGLMRIETGERDENEDRTYALVNIGEKKVNDQLNDTDKPFFLQFVDFLSKKTGLNYQAGNILGSDKGATWMQYMPFTAMELIQFYKDTFGEDLNLADPKSAIRATYIFLARGQIVGVNKDGSAAIRYGTLNDGTLVMLDVELAQKLKQYEDYGLEKWNPDGSEVEAIKKSNQSYHNSDILQHLNS